MKKIYAFMAAALMSASLFAAAPTVEDLATVYDVANNVVLCFQPIEDATVCSDIYFVGSPNNWGKGEGNTEDFANCEKFAPVPGFDGWYAAELPYSDGFYGKPLHNTQDGTFSWDYQCGDPESWVYVAGNEITLNLENGSESSMGYPSAGVYIYQLKYWKLHRNPCAAVVKHNYTIKVYAPDACADMKPAVAGDDMGWSAHAMNEELDDEFNTVYTYSFEGQEGHAFKIIEAVGGWNNEMQHYDAEAADWKNFDNQELGATETIVLDYSDNSKFRFTKCDGVEPIEVSVKAKLPAAGCPEKVEILGSFGAGWDGAATAMTFNASTGYFEATFTARPDDEFKFRGEGSWDVQIQVIDENNEGAWKDMPNVKIEDNIDGNNVVELNLSDPAEYRWTPASQGIEEVVLTEKAHKVIVDGVLYIVRDNKMFNIQGAQVR